MRSLLYLSMSFNKEGIKWFRQDLFALLCIVILFRSLSLCFL